MSLGSIDEPATPEPATGGDAGIAQREVQERSVRVAGILDVDDPPSVLGPVTHDADVAPDVDEHAVRSLGDDQRCHEVGGEALPDAAGVDADTWWQGHGVEAIVELDPLAARCRVQRLISRPAAVRADLGERPVVAAVDHRLEHRRVVSTRSQAPRLDRPLHQPVGLG